MARTKKTAVATDAHESEKKSLELRKLFAETLRAELLLEKTLHERDASQADASANHIYTFWNEVNEDTVKECIAELSLWHRQSPKCPITIVLNSPGGSVVEGLALYDFLMGLRRKRHHLTVIVLGEAASMGGVLLQVGNTRVMGRNAFLMIHEISYGAYGKSAEHRDEMALVKKMESKLLRILTKRSTFSVRELRARWERKDWWLDAKEAVANGFVDKID